MRASGGHEGRSIISGLTFLLLFVAKARPELLSGTKSKGNVSDSATFIHIRTKTQSPDPHAGWDLQLRWSRFEIPTLKSKGIYNAINPTVLQATSSTIQNHSFTNNNYL
ncbi:hypothetical protein [Echinicola arenosa]|uniref:hypothetical protein n=1 Tax=Echinicola arenosa TaxID=2774144 RepID=UPI0017817830|nr:hypothetical protein [Echinicola arenosa]